MWQIDEGKVIVLTRGGLTDVEQEKKKIPKHGAKLTVRSQQKPYYRVFFFGKG